MKNIMIFVRFLLDFSIPPRSGGLRNTRLVFRGPIWMRLNNSGIFCVGQVPRTSHAATSPKKHVSDASVPRCHDRLQRTLPQVCSWLVVEGILNVIRTRYLDNRTCSWTTLYVFSPFFGRFFQTNTRRLFAAACCCYIFTISLFFTFLSPPRCVRQGRMMVVLLHQRSGAAYYIHKIKEMVVPARLCYD